MKLLIVDDEELTRTGVISSINWESLGIDEVLQADDGIHGLETARMHRPEIILCDVRMPRMNGIAMLERLEKILPDSVPIFMSGYSDKDYLKAAIKLKAVNYIEKPLNPQEVKEAVLSARELYFQKQHSRRGETYHSMETASKLALCLTAPYGPNSETIHRLVKELSLKLTPETSFTAFILKLDISTELAEPYKLQIFQALQAYLKPFHLNGIYVEKRTQYLVYLVFGPSKPSRQALGQVADFLGREFAPYGKYTAAVGETFFGVSRAYQSYSSAVILLQNSFFFPINTFLFPSVLESTPPSGLLAPQPLSTESAFYEALLSKDPDAAQKILDGLFSYFDRNYTLLPNQVKDFYYKLFLALSNARKQLTVTGSSGMDGIVDSMENCFNFQELHQALIGKTSLFFADLKDSVQENPTIFLIKDYIAQNYMDPALSVKDISTHVHLSTSYVCTFFKNETGHTLNQYLTEYRMERAKQLLSDIRYKIAEISSKVGYSDGNYFGKSFKKYTGLSPSEYREKMIQ